MSSNEYGEFKKLWKETVVRVNINGESLRGTEYMDSVLAMRMAEAVLGSPSDYPRLYARVSCRTLAGFYRFFRWVLEGPWVLGENFDVVKKEGAL